MAILPVLFYPDEHLTQKAEPVTVFDKKLEKLANDMLETMYSVDCVGLAANQVGVLQRVMVMDFAEENEPKAPKIYINPEITFFSKQTINEYEGCASFPAAYTAVKRSKVVKVKYQDLQGNFHEEESTDDLHSTCLQHELDHLNGILFTDRVSKLKRDMILRRLQKAKRYMAEHAKNREEASQDA